ncbi:class I SAM-dependent methyltransferase [Kutzneria sp. CA-103260]|uniref:class I SAM-dependent methyltransferase n=1 Tax=Kutzneria sp. CA-103260 TaxID=2802641 RepID=UPI001BACCE5D|nr:class I SAM-dependent methyltransferase [Kutzneria sp. CA-103260]QUQ64183.1 Ubiquinone biosynthesis O-methyltransferase, mitochondrial [Kutzneria sp. CA-103260]
MTAAEPYFDDLAELYERFTQVRDAATSPVRSWLTAQLSTGARAIDVGCGGGNNCGLLADRYDEVVGVDISQKMLDIASTKPTRVPVRYECRSATDLTPDRDGQFDLVMSVNAVFHMGPAEVVLPTLRDLVAPGGRLVIIDVTQPDDGAEPREQSAYAFETGKIVYDVSGDVAAAVDSIRMMLHPRWLEMSAQAAPLSETEFTVQYEKALPGVRITKNVIPTMSAAVWDAA